MEAIGHIGAGFLKGQMDRLGGGQESEEVHSRKQQPPRAYERLVNKISDVRWAGTDGPDPSTSVSEIQLWLFFIPWTARGGPGEGVEQ